MKTFWQVLPRPFFILAPMEDVTDIVFRQMVAACGRPDVFFTEFTSADGLVSAGGKRVAERLWYTAQERPIVAQIWGNNPDTIREASAMIVKMGFDGIDINMGCPQRKIVKKGFCAGLIRTPQLAKELYLAAAEGAGNVPVSIKTRIGFDRIQTEEWIGFLLELSPAALTIHCRTAKEMSLVPAHWDQVAVAVHLRNTMKSTVPIIGNGDVKSTQQGRELAQSTGADGIMIGRGIFENIALFHQGPAPRVLPFAHRLQLLRQHIRLFSATWQGKKPYMVLKKFFKIYISDIPGAHHRRIQLMATTTPEEALEQIHQWLHDMGEEEVLSQYAQPQQAGNNQVDGNKIIKKPGK